MYRQIMNGLRMAGQKVRAVDDAYASKLANYIGGFNTKKPSVGQTAQVVAGLGVGVPATRRFEVDEQSAVLRELMGYGIPALNAGVRYGVPAAGAYAAVQGLTDVLQQNNQADVDMNPQEVRFSPMAGM